MAGKSEFWSGRVGFILANVAAAVGLGSIWKFPYEVGANGGSTFVVSYLAGLTLIVLPLMLAELAIGRRGRSDAVASVAAVASQGNASTRWSLFALLGVVTGFLILSFYSVIGGWAIAYLIDVALNGLGAEDAGSAKVRFDALLGSPLRVLSYHFAFMTMTCFVVARGIAGGIEHASKFLMPALVVLIALLAFYAVRQGDFWTTWHYLFAFDAANVRPMIMLEALGLGFFSIGVGLSTMITYAAYAGRDIDLGQVALFTLVSDTVISFLAAFAVFPIVFAEGLDPSSGSGLVFITLPVAFSRMPFGTAAAVIFFLLLVVAALGSAISLLELAVAPLRNALRCSQARASILCAAGCWGIGIVTVLSFSRWADWFPLAGLPAFARATVFDLLDHLTSNVLLPIGGLGIAIFTGWIVPEKILHDELRLARPTLRVTRFMLRYVVPAGIAFATVAPYL
jgi:neurotransmitter:Na+ symporter, NSS family